MAITLADFSKIWASTSPLTPYSFSDSNYQEGWNFIGATPPARQMWDSIQKQNDEKMQYIVDNFLPLSGGTMTGNIASNFAYKNTVDNGAFKVYAGTDATGSAIFMYGKDAPSFAGYFQIKCGDGVNDASLIGSPTGSLTWDGNTVATTNVDTTTISASPVGDGVFTVSKVGGVGFVYLSSLSSLPASQYTSVTAVLPVGYRPSYTFVKTITLIAGATTRSNVVIRIQTDGSVSFYNYGTAVSSAQLVYEVISYPIGG